MTECCSPLDCCANPEPRVRFSAARVSTGMLSRGSVISDTAASPWIDTYWQLVRDNIKRMFRDLGLELHGRPLDPPQIIFWNVRADTVGYPAAADDRGVMMLSGFSPALLKFVLSGEMEQEVIVGVDAAGNAVKEKQQICPREALRRVLYDSGLDAVRAALDAMPVAAFLCA